MTVSTTGSYLGHPVRRTEDTRFLTGAALFVDDLALADPAHAVMVRSTAPHARLAGIDTAAAVAMPGVVAVFTAGDLGLPPLPPNTVAPAVMGRPPLAEGKVRFAGEAVAVVVAETPAEAVDAAGEVIVDYDPLPGLPGPLEALAPGAAVLFPEHGTNIAATYAFGADDDLFEGSDVVVSGRFVNQRLAVVPLEVNGAAAEIDAAGRLTLWVSNQHPGGIRPVLARILGLPEERIRVACPAVGGGFGAKVGIAPEHVVVAAAALRLRRAVRWVESRSESMTAMTQGRAQIHDVEMGATRDGTITALRVRITADAGAYPVLGAFLPMVTGQMAAGVYRIPKVDFAATVAVTNTTPTAAYRGAGRPEATALLERAVDLVAADLDLDPADVRRRNLIPSDAFPHTTVTGAAYDVGDYAGALDLVLRLAGYDELREEQRRRRERGGQRCLGIGVSAYVEVTGAGPSPEFAAVEVAADGSVTATTGTVPHGQGHETAFAQIVASTLGVPLEAVTVVHSDTDRVESSGGTFGSRSLQLGGSSVLVAAEAVLGRAKERAAELLEAAPGDIVLHPGPDGVARIGVAGAPAAALSWAQVAGRGSPLREAARFPQPANTFPFGAHVCVVEVDTETGAVDLLRHVAVDDCGRILNPMIVTGQVHGGLAQGLGQALFEQVAYDADANPLTTNLADYTIASAAELPSFETAHTETPTPLNPLGAKGIGESGTIGSMPAAQSAVIDALAHLGVRHVDTPATPQRVYQAIETARRETARRQPAPRP